MATKEETTNKGTEELSISSENLLEIVKAVSQVYPMIVLANLSKNTYTLLRNEVFLQNEISESGCYDDLIDDNQENIHSNYQELFQKCFGRENLLKRFREGKTDVYAELYQKNKSGEYQWVSTHAIKIEDGSGDICHICLNRVLDGIVREKYGSRN